MTCECNKRIGYLKYVLSHWYKVKDNDDWDYIINEICKC